jgi:hypothetical protein
LLTLRLGDGILFAVMDGRKALKCALDMGNTRLLSTWFGTLVRKWQTMFSLRTHPAWFSQITELLLASRDRSSHQSFVTVSVLQIALLD